MEGNQIGIDDYEEGHGIVIVFTKFLIFLAGISAIAVNLTAHFEFGEYTQLFPEFKNAELTGELATFSGIMAFISIYGSLLYYIEDQPDYRQSTTIALQTFLIWDISLSLILFAFTFVVFYCYMTVDYIFDDGFFQVMADYQNKPELASLINSIQETYACCGNLNYTEWFYVQWTTEITAEIIAIPESCCNKVYAEFVNITCEWKTSYSHIYKLIPYKIGCLDVIKWWYAFYFLITTSLFILAFLCQATMFKGKRRTYSTMEKKRLIFQQGAMFQAAMEGGQGQELINDI
ncbi:hypothetical protein HELRODRAFT_162670 [Helobdella robusta]|uniref:Tetraspanin n=1 Tax=Helobdella robusta TaxID=6412 RepID=T1ESZ9_HELRO|nr:hypothetical protein HELRODRAFT_162670 [Helobdella robusta]ESN99175.1 hypothetical protein HELRODRAFT_162670 [Helobdella robusta]